jgi:hypothetical protein
MIDSRLALTWRYVDRLPLNATRYETPVEKPLLAKIGRALILHVADASWAETVDDEGTRMDTSLRRALRDTFTLIFSWSRKAMELPQACPLEDWMLRIMEQCSQVPPIGVLPVSEDRRNKEQVLHMRKRAELEVEAILSRREYSGELLQFELAAWSLRDHASSILVLGERIQLAANVLARRLEPGALQPVDEFLRFCKDSFFEQ